MTEFEKELYSRFISIKNHPTYGVNALGEIKNLKTGRILKPIPDAKGYLKVRLDGKKETVSRIVAERFVKNPEGKPNVMYRDGNKANVFFNNLRWASNSEIKRPDKLKHKRIT